MRADQTALLDQSQFIRREEPVVGVAVPLVRDPTRLGTERVGRNEQGCGPQKIHSSRRKSIKLPPTIFVCYVSNA
jgi:hypothetical protein